jgi:hypothetical protein
MSSLEYYITRKFPELYRLPSIVNIVKSMRLRLAGHVTQKGEKRNAYRILWWGCSLRKCYLEDREVKLEYILGKYVVRIWSGWKWLRIKSNLLGGYHLNVITVILPTEQFYKQWISCSREFYSLPRDAISGLPVDEPWATVTPFQHVYSQKHTHQVALRPRVEEVAGPAIMTEVFVSSASPGSAGIIALNRQWPLSLHPLAIHDSE